MSMIVKFEIYHDGENWCGRGIGHDIFTHGKSLDDLMASIGEAVRLHFEDMVPGDETITILSLTEIQVTPLAKTSGC